ncbi:MAG: rhodanese-like domain-containing protein [Campylobacterota bacterium]|nr:rhodanese-like domain-containing protein [Campylobacterota bacterium]
MKKIVTSTLLMASLSISAFAYDTTKAQTFDKFYSNFTQKTCASSKLFIQADETMKMLRENKKFTLLDIRTKGEHAVISIGLKNSIYIPIKDLFKKENLDKLPTDQTIVIVCHSGTRATLAAIGLKQIGIKNTRVLKGGLISLADANNPKNAPLRLGMKIQ